MAIKSLIFLSLLAVALGYILPDSEFIVVYAEPEPAQYEAIQIDDGRRILVRNARSPQGSMSGTFEHSRQMGSSAGIDYNRQIGKNFEAYAGASRNFKYNDNSAHAGLRYRF